MKKSRANDESKGTEERPQALLKPYEALKSILSWTTWLMMKYQSYFFEDGKKIKGPILDNCPGCGGLGFINGTTMLNLYNQGLSEYSVGYACPICLTGKDKNERVGISQYQDKPICQFFATCPFTNEAQKQEKCRKCTCKFDPESKKPSMTQGQFDKVVEKLTRFKNMNSALASKIIEHAELALENEK